MAANTALGATSSLPRHVVLAGVGTTWQEFTLHQGARPGKVTVFADATCYVAFSGDNSAASPADGGAVGTMKITLTAAQAAAGYVLALSPGPMRAGSVFVAAVSSTITATLVQE
tara:strand:- start:181 stop:522 length:342 start_codon:yes stop_codon:yes gene_type:complete